MLPGRIVNLLATYASYIKNGILLSIEDKHTVFALKCCDDLGLFMYVPWFSSFFDLDPLQGVRIFFLGITIVFFLVTSISFLAMVKNIWGYLAISLGLYRLTDPLRQLSYVYLGYLFPFMAIPVLLVALEKKHKNLFLFSFFLCGLVAGFSDILRILSALPVILFFLIILCFNSTFVRFKKIIPLAIFLAGYAIPYGHFKYVIHKRDTFLKEHNSINNTLPDAHIFWHNMYIGFGFLANKHDITWEDSCGARHARQVLPGVEVGSKDYEDITRTFIINLIKTDRYFVANALFAKFGVLIFFFLLYLGFLGILAAYFVPKAWYIEFAFFCCAGMSAMPGILTLPVTAYFMGFITCTSIYTIYSLIWFFNNNGIKEIKKSYKSLVHTIKTTE